MPAAAAIGGAVLAVVVVVLRNPIRDHLEVWHFQLTQDTEPFLPGPALESDAMLSQPILCLQDRKPFRVIDPIQVCRQLASCTSTPVIIDRESRSFGVMLEPLDDSSRLSTMGGGELMLFILETAGYRVIEQRFPRRAYVVLRPSDLRVISSKTLAPWPRQPILWDGPNPPVRIQEPYLDLPRDLSRERP